MENENVKAKMAELRQRYAKLALTCRAAGMRVDPQTVQSYLNELQKLQTELN
jgi:hypothetical protein